MKNDERTEEQKGENYIPLSINAGGGDTLSNKPFHVLKVLSSIF